MKKHTKISKKRVLCKAVLMFDGSIEHIDKNRGKKDVTSRKTNCFFDAIAILEDEKWSYLLHNRDYGHDLKSTGLHSAYNKFYKQMTF